MKRWLVVLTFDAAALAVSVTFLARHADRREVTGVLAWLAIATIFAFLFDRDLRSRPH